DIIDLFIKIIPYILDKQITDIISVYDIIKSIVNDKELNLNTDIKNAVECLPDNGTNANNKYKFLSIRNLCKILHQVLLMKYNEHYGFPTLQSHSKELQNYAVPYKAGFDPISGSQFSDLDFQIIVTIVAYYKRNHMTINNIETFLNDIVIKEYETYYQFNLKEWKEWNDVFKEYVNLFEINIDTFIQMIKT